MTAATTNKTYPVIVIVLVLVIAAMVYKFIVSGSTEKAADGRVSVVLAPGERALVLREMRDFVAGIQLITDALSRNDMKGVARAARAMGSTRMHDAPVAMMGRLPLAFKTLGFGVHHEFDSIAMDDEGIGIPAHTLAQLSGVLQKCVACHATYQLQVEATQ